MTILQAKDKLVKPTSELDDKLKDEYGNVQENG
jgi:hypothetical protein